MIAAAPVAHADETTARADGALRYVHVACTDYLTVLHTGDRTAAPDRRRRGLARVHRHADAGRLQRLRPPHPDAARLVRRAHPARSAGHPRREPGRAGLGRRDGDNHGDRSSLAHDARTLIRRMHREEDLILQFVVDLTVPFSNNQAERAVRPVKVQQRTSGGCWRTLTGLVDFAIVQSYLSTAAKWGLDTLDTLERLFTTGPWLPPAAEPG
jgi:transposase